MKKLFFLFAIAYFTIQPGFSNELSIKEKTYYWFYIRLKSSFDRQTKSKKLEVQSIGREIESGNLNQFVKRHGYGLHTGLIFIGPFTDENKAIEARNLYKEKKVSKNEAADSLKSAPNDSTLFYYLTRPLLGKWLKPVGFQRIPSRIASGSINDFLSVLNEGLAFQIFAIGPFEDYALAEKSKFTFRKNGEPGFIELPDTTQPITLVDMVEKWKTIEMEIIEPERDYSKNKGQYAIEIKFPANYFIEDAFQTITIRPKYSNPKLISNTGITFQGDYVMDNNEIIPFDKATVFSQAFSFARYTDVSLEGFDIESFVFNGTKMLEQETRFLVAK
jgi:hypothetical protein